MAKPERAQKSIRYWYSSTSTTTVQYKTSYLNCSREFDTKVHWWKIRTAFLSLRQAWNKAMEQDNENNSSAVPNGSKRMIPLYFCKVKKATLPASRPNDPNHTFRSKQYRPSRTTRKINAMEAQHGRQVYPESLPLFSKRRKRSMLGICCNQALGSTITAERSLISAWCVGLITSIWGDGSTSIDRLLARSRRWA